MIKDRYERLSAIFALLNNCLRYRLLYIGVIMGTLLFIIAGLLLMSKGVIFNSDSDSSKRNFLIFSGILLVAFSGCRNATINMNSDLNNYYRLFSRAITSESFATFSSTSTMETGYLLLNWLIARIIKWPQFIIFFQAAFCIGVTLRFIYKFSDEVLLSVLSFMSFGLMQFYLTGFRQSFAIALCLVALELAIKKKFIAYAIIVFLAVSFHQTAIVFIPVYWIVKAGLTKINTLVDFGLIICLSQAVPRLILLGNEVFDKEYQGVFTGNNLGGIVNILVELVVIGIMFYQSERYSKPQIISNSSSAMSRPLNGFFYLLTIGMGIYALRFQALVLERISLYFTPCLIILLPHIIETSFEKESKKIVKIVFIVMMIFLSWWRLHSYSYNAFWTSL